MKFHFIDLIPDIKAIIGMNGLIWVYYSTVKLENEYFSDDQNKLNTLSKNEAPNEFASINIILFKNIIKILENNKINIDQFSIMKFYEIYINTIEKIKLSDKNNKQSDGEFLKTRIVINKETEREVIDQLRILILSTIKTTNIVDLGREAESLRKIVENKDESGDEDN